ncbi:hypothetical protein [Natrinema sp. DC36]|uniref:hypothetical protein n=1 Tax=Natrinema sp. DC36 TaxID=2878680 RepID=UPI001CF00549|nr:hypothetical protein [Natrinema sp. DC36]
MSEDHPAESGKRAEAENIISPILKVLNKHGIRLEGGKMDGLNWRDESDREMVREKFAQNGPVEDPLLPGMGPDGYAENAYDDCGNPHPHVCDDCGWHVDFGRTCSRSVCARCGAAWNADYAKKKAAKMRRVRIEQYKSMKEDPNWNRNILLHHQIISAPLGWYYDLARSGYTLEEANEETRQVVKDILNEMRAQGMLIRHDYRGKNEDGELEKDAGATDDLGEWKPRLYHQLDWHGEDGVREELAWNPHYHCVVAGDFLKGGEMTEEIEAATGWVIHRIADDKDRSIQNDGKMLRVLMYDISHCSIVQNGDQMRSTVWEVGSFEGDGIRNSSRFSPSPADLEWATNCAERNAYEMLGINITSTECGQELPGVDDPDELARNILEELYPDDPGKRLKVDNDLIHHHLLEGNLSVEISTHSGGGGDVTVRDAWGQPVGNGGWGGNVPDVPSDRLYEGSDEPVAAIEPIADQEDVEIDADQEASSEEEDEGCECCTGKLRPLEQIRREGLLEDDEWLADARHADAALEADAEHSDDLEPWQADTVFREDEAEEAAAG